MEREHIVLAAVVLVIIAATGLLPYIVLLSLTVGAIFAACTYPLPTIAVGVVLIVILLTIRAFRG